MKKETVYNLDSTTVHLPTYNKDVGPSEGIEVSPEDAAKMVESGMWSKDNPAGGKKK